MNIIKRSEINKILKNSLDFFNKNNFNLPKWSTWKISDWKANKENALEIFENNLGWDITDFNLGTFDKKGIVLFTIRNGGVFGNKNYCEKIMISQENQICPMHFHWKKKEDIINRGGGNLVMKLYKSENEDNLSKSPITVYIDGIKKIVDAGETIILTPGESICIEPYVYHSFWGEEGKGKVLIGEVSKVNDDENDNKFFEKLDRFSEIQEDEEPFCLLINDYKKFIL